MAEGLRLAGYSCEIFEFRVSLSQFHCARADSPSASVIPPAAGVKSPELFHVTREETGTFPGNWEPLRGKSVKIYSVQPVQSATLETTPREKLSCVKELFLRAWKTHSAADAATAGVVVVFDSADGGKSQAGPAGGRLEVLLHHHRRGAVPGRPGPDRLRRPNHHPGREQH